MEPQPESEPEQELEPGQCAVDYDARYSTGWAYGKKPNAFLVDAANAWLLADGGAPRAQSVGARPPQVLSLGEGQGRNVAFLAEHGYQCLAVDASTVGLDKARTLAAQRGVLDLVQTCAADLTAFEPGATSDGCAAGREWDVILSIFCGLPPAPRARLHRSCAESLAPGGIVIIECFAPTSAAVSADETAKMRAFRPGPPESERVSHTQLAAEFAGLQVLFAREVTRPLNEGRFHRGVATLTQFVARAPREAKSELQHSPRRFARYCESINAVFAEAQMYQRDRSDSEVIASAATAYQLAAKPTGCLNSCDNQGGELDALLFSARALLSVTCAAAVRGKICRYCWVPQASCFCQQLAAVSCRVRPAVVETSASQTASSERSTPDRRARLKSRNIRWVIITHPSEFLRSSSTARLAAALLGSGDCTPVTSQSDDVETATETQTELFRSSDCELLVFGSARHEAVLHEVVGSAVPPLVLFPLPAGQSEAPTEALTSVQRVDMQSARSTIGSEDAVTLTVLVPDGSWDCARALVRALVALRCSLTASNGAPGSPMRFIRLSDDLVAHHTSSIIDALRTGAGKGRLSTLEAMAMVPVEAATATDAVIRRASSPLSGDCADSELAQPSGPDALISSVLALVGQCAGFRAAFAGLALLVSFVQTQNTLYSEPPEFTKVSPPPRCAHWCTVCRAALYHYGSV